MNDKTDEKVINNEDEISLGDIINRTKTSLRYLVSKWVVILALGFLGGVIGLAYSIFKKPVYTAVCTFVLEDGSKGGGLSQYAGLASLAGIDLNGGSGGVFQGDNILELYKSRTMIEKALLSTGSFDGKQELLIEKYIQYNNLRPAWKKNDNIDSITFNDNPDNFNRKQDSIITDIVELFNKKNLSVVKPDKKLSIINVQFSSKDELFAKEFVNRLVENVNKFYIQTKIKKTLQNVLVLQKQADSVRNILNSSINGVASAIDATPNANPSLLTLRVPSQKRQVDVQASTAIYSEIVKNLEVSKISLRQDTPLIQIIDAPVLPLANNKLTKIKGIVFGGFLGIFTAIFCLTVKKLTGNIFGNG